jgi:hypothetical protein
MPTKPPPPTTSFSQIYKRFFLYNSHQLTVALNKPSHDNVEIIARSINPSPQNPTLPINSSSRKTI